MRNLRRLAAISVLFVSLSGIALAGDLQGPNIAPPPPPPLNSQVAGETTESTQTSDLSTETELAIFVSWLVSSIF